VSGTPVTASEAQDGAGDNGAGGSGAQAETRPAGRLAAWRQPASLVIIGVALVALAVRLYYFTRPGYLLGVTEYDDGSYFGSAVRLVHGVLPYRDFVFVQPPGITLLMAPVAEISKLTGTGTGLAIARVLTMVAGAAGAALAGMLVRHRGTLAALIASGVVAVYADSVASSHTLLVEPWLVLFCLAGAVAVFDGDRFTERPWRLVLGGAAFGYAGAIEVWAIIPVLVIVVLSIRRLRRTAWYVAGVAAGFLITVLPLALLAWHSFYDDVITAQLAGRPAAVRVPLWFRFEQMAGFANYPDLRRAVVLGVVAVLVLVVLGSIVAATALTRALPPAVEWFSYGTGALIVAIFLWPSQFHYHFSGFLAPFYGLAVALPASRLLIALRDRATARPAPVRVLAGAAIAVAVVVLAAGTVSQVSFEHTLKPDAPLASMAAGKRIIPYGSCVLADNVAYTITANRFVNRVPGCPTVDDGTGANFALSGGLEAHHGAGVVPAVASMWWSAFRHADYVWLTGLNERRIAWTPPLRYYFRKYFVRVHRDLPKFRLYERRSLAQH
jgi:hypothetical protein